MIENIIPIIIEIKHLVSEAHLVINECQRCDVLLVLVDEDQLADTAEIGIWRHFHWSAFIAMDVLTQWNSR